MMCPMREPTADIMPPTFAPNAPPPIIGMTTIPANSQSVRRHRKWERIETLS
jgi:hypothetical protein